MKDIGAVLKNARENKEFTQKQVMELTGINKKSLSGYENNVAEPDLQTFATLINLYGLFFLFYSVRSAVTGSLLAAFLEGINPPINVSTTLKKIRTIAGATGSTALT